jgi:hypothetical protein
MHCFSDVIAIHLEQVYLDRSLGQPYEPFILKCAVVAWSPDSIKAEPCGCAQKWPRFSGQNQGMIKAGNGSLNLFYVFKI